ncbi:MAG: PASTA domain-containing protein [Gaiellales bacterium]
MPAPPTRRPDPVLMTLREPDDEEVGAGDPEVTVEPGGEAMLICSIRNQSGKVDRYDLRVQGLPEGWATVAPEAIDLLQFGAPVGGWEKDVQVRFHPTRDGRESRSWEVTVVARSQSSGQDIASARLTLTVPPYSELTGELRPKTASGRRSARFAAAATNTGNAPVEVEWEGSDENQQCRFKFERQRTGVRPGRESTTVVRVRAVKRPWFGKPVDHRFELVGTPVGSDTGEVVVEGTFRQRPRIPTWVPAAAVIAIALGIVGYKLWPRYVTVPPVAGEQAKLAQAQLQQKGFKVALVNLKPSRHGQPGTVRRTDPAGNASVKSGSQVTLYVRTSPNTVAVPSLCNDTIAAANKALPTTLTLSTNPPATSTTDKIRATKCQQQAPGTQVPKGTTIVAFLAGKTTVSGGGGSGGSAKVPAAAAAGASAAAAIAALTSAGIPYHETLVLSHKKPNTVIKIQPSGTVPKGQVVELQVSAGNPLLAYDSGGVLSTQPALGGTPKPLAPGVAQATEPAWSGDGRKVAFIAGPSPDTNLYWVGLSSRNSPTQIAGASQVHRPAFAPDPKSSVIAYASYATGSTGELCFVDVSLTTASSSPSCVFMSSWMIDRPAWAPDGMAILAISGGTLVEYTSTIPSSGNQASWHPVTAGVQQPQAGNAVWSVAWGPLGPAAVVGGAVYLGKTSGDVITSWSPVSLPTSTPACTVAWRSDGQLVVSLVPTGVTPSSACTTSPGGFELVEPSVSPPAVQTLTTTANGASNPASQPTLFSTP